MDLEWKENILTCKDPCKVSRSALAMETGNLFNAEAGKTYEFDGNFSPLAIPPEYNLWMKPVRVTARLPLLLITGHNASGIIRMSVRPFPRGSGCCNRARSSSPFFLVYVCFTNYIFTIHAEK